MTASQRSRVENLAQLIVHKKDTKYGYGPNKDSVSITGMGVMVDNTSTGNQAQSNC